MADRARLPSPLLRPSLAWLAVAALAFGGCMKASREASPAAGRSNAPAADPATGAAGDHPLATQRALEVRVEWELELATVEEAAAAARPLMALARGKGGFVEQWDQGGGSSQSTLLLRIPVAELDAVRQALAKAGPIGRESITMKDVTEAIADVDARVRAAQAEEARLLVMLERRTGVLADVLAAERALAGVRERIEQLEAAQRAAHGRVDLAAVSVVFRHGVLAAAAAPFGRQLASAAGAGVSTLTDVAEGLLLFLLRAGPTLLFLAALGVVGWRTVRRLLARRARPTTLP